MPLEGSNRSSGNGVDPSEEQPLLSSPRKPARDDEVVEEALLPDADVRIILPVLMFCAFLAAFDVTLVAAIYPIMYSPLLTCY
jgi:hypothetical protein